MELVGMAKELLQNAAETAVSYGAGQAVLRYADRALWVVEKSARWAVPPALDQDDNTTPAPELIRPLPWVFFLSLLVLLRVAREAMSLVNLILGKPPVRPADVVMYIQSKRRYLRALKYQGNRNMRARANRPQAAGGQWLSSLQSLVEFTMCFRRPLDYATNNNTNLPSNNDDQMLVVKKKKRSDKGKQRAGSSAPCDENTMERLIEKMVDMYGESSDDSEYTLTNATSIKSDSTITSEEEETAEDVTLTTPDTEPTSSTPNKPDMRPASPAECSQIKEDSLLDTVVGETESPKEATENLINSERNTDAEPTAEDNPKKPTKIVNGQTRKSTSNKKDSPKRRDSEVPVVKITPADDSNNTNGSTED